MRLFLIMIIVSSALLAGCTKKTTVVLLPDSEGNVGSVDVKSTEGGSRTLSKAGERTVVRFESWNPSKPKVAKDQGINNSIEELKASQPPKPVSYTLYFKHASIYLTDESEKLIPVIIEEARKREPSEVSLIGHSDTMGPADYNVLLSKQRAQAVYDILAEEGLDIRKLHVESHGENDLLIQTEDDVSEPRNRRVEVMIR
ncbi:OmpA family protein [Limisalsivibrio acetivorans]|uniref:OmpA family protein n=1 Tax=Limisalsivibrio acetivorans TaxID=1304888 RepID=UPI0003B704A1|nr:OmpA family protein [Limisalsivibrio acetivorans]